MKRQRDEPSLIIALATGSSITDAARLSGYSVRTAKRRVADADFAARVSATRDALWQQAVGKLAGVAVEAVETLRDLLQSDSPAVRLGAAKAILVDSPKLRDAVEHEARITKLESSNAKRT